MSPCTPGQNLRGFLFSQIRQLTSSIVAELLSSLIASAMTRRFDVHLKVELELDEAELAGKSSPERLAAEMCRNLMKLYGVRQAELTSVVEKD